MHVIYNIFSLTYHFCNSACWPHDHLGNIDAVRMIVTAPLMGVDLNESVYNVALLVHRDEDKKLNKYVFLELDTLMIHVGTSHVYQS